ncbi:MAG: Fic family protein [Oculatellaceae cyanobacterium Prado106]|jgi:Fic family protein|nr:Fic family protein [Oculatellaceae cyanobacterium Prado106]
MTISDPHYSPNSLEPLLPQRSRRLEDLAMELGSQTSRLSHGLHPIVVQSLGNLVRSMNCYYSNLIEGHRTTPREIERALREDFSSQPEQRDLQMEAKAHIEVQSLIDLSPEWQADSVLSPEFMQRIHREFYQRLPPRFWQLGAIAVLPGEFRTSPVQIGRHVPPPPESLAPFLTRFAQGYHPDRLSKVDQVLATAAAHHRFLWIHPFLDGNGRVARLLSQAYLQRIGVGNSLWSVSRGLARQVQQYRDRLDEADQQRQNDYDGRGNLPLTGLGRFCEFFLETCIDQAQFMATLLEPRQLLDRMEMGVAIAIREKHLLPGSFPLLKAAFLEGTVQRGQAATLTGYQERQARSVLKRLLERGLLVADSPKSPVRLGFPVVAAEQWFPRLWLDL